MNTLANLTLPDTTDVPVWQMFLWGLLAFVVAVILKEVFGAIISDAVAGHRRIERDLQILQMQADFDAPSATERPPFDQHDPRHNRPRN